MTIERLLRHVWATPEKLEAIGEEILALAPALGTRLELSLFDPTEDAALERTLSELARRTADWPPERRDLMKEYVTYLDALIRAMSDRAEVGKIENCVMLMDLLSAWISGTGERLRNTDPQPLELLDLASMGTQAIVALLVQAAQRVGDTAAAVALIKHVPVLRPEPTIH